MSDRRKSILDKLFDCVNNGLEWGVSQVKNPCPSRKKFANLQEKIDSEVELESRTRMRVGDDAQEGPDSGIGKAGGSDSEMKAKEGPNSDSGTRIGREEGTGSQNKDLIEKYSPCQPGGPYLQPDQICPNINDPPCCVILMQDPCRLCCCEPKEKQDEQNLEPCPPKKGYLDEPREPTCTCDSCKNNSHAKGCAEKGNIFGEENNGSRLERA